MGVEKDPKQTIEDDGSLSLDDVTITNQATVDGGEEVFGSPSTTNSPTYSIGDGWRTPSADRPVIVAIRGVAETDGSTRGSFRMEVDESGGTASDYRYSIAWADDGLGSQGQTRNSGAIPLVAGASYRLVNGNDPNGGNQAATIREVIY